MNNSERKTKRREKGELLFERYLRETGHGGGDELEPDLGIDTNPDYKISKGGAEAVTEVKEFTDGKLHRRITDPNGNKVFTVGDKEQFNDVRKKIKDAAPQLKPLAGSGVPLVVVITNPNNIFVPLGDIDICAAMYGMPAVGGDLDPELGQVVNMGLVPGRNGKLTVDHQHISAVVVLGIRSYLQDAQDKWCDENRERLDAEFADDLNGKGVAIYEGVMSVSAPEGDYVYARVFHTESEKAAPLPPELFDGPHDVHLYPSRQPI